MHGLVIFALVGFAAQMVDGTLGMAYGVTSSTLLLVAGYSPAAASATVHLAELGTTLAAGVSHWRFGNVDWRVVRRLALPGAVGAFAGATVLSSLSTEAAKPWMAGLLVLLGIYVLLRFVGGVPIRRHESPPRRRMLMPLGVVAGFVDATGGGGWGPIATPTLIATGRMEPRKVIGTVGTSEFLVALGASAGFVLGLKGAGISLPTVAALLAGGVVAAPLAAWLVHHVPARMLGSGVGGLIILTNTRTLLNTYEVAPGLRNAAYLSIAVLWMVAVAASARGVVADR
ncbi:MAG: sulfite exporter TauE/SafE family protein, partial [Actinomycetota bacterium]|nr:sulfite exporter TauE/SafE family protein [Actinomycetota bacterium]